MLVKRSAARKMKHAGVRDVCVSNTRKSRRWSALRSEVDIAQLLDIRAFDLDRVLAFDPSFLLEEEEAA